MGQWAITRPEAGQNMIQNPSAEFTLGFAPRNNAAVSRSTTYAYKGRHSFEVVSSLDDEGATFTLSALSNAVHYVTMLARGTFGGTWQWSLNGADWSAPTSLGTDGSWTQYGASFLAAQATGSTTLYVRQSGAGASDYYMDAVQVEAQSYPSTFMDGEQEGCSWDGAHDLPPDDIYDGFTRADSASLGSADSGEAWTESTYAISTNKAVNTPTESVERFNAGDFAVVGDWLDTVGTWTIAAGVASHAGAGALLYQNVVAANWWCHVVWNIVDYTAGVINSRLGGNYGPNRTTLGAYDEMILADGAVAGFECNGAFVGALDNVSCKYLTAADLFAKLTCYAVDGVAECAMTIAANRQAGMVLRYQNDSNYLLAYVDRLFNMCYLKSCVAGVNTNIFAGAAVTYAASKRLRVVLSGTTATVYYGGVLVGTGTVPSSTYKVHGLFSTDSGNSFTAFRWMQAASGSSSTRSGQSRAGGRVINIEDTYDVLIQNKSGYGMPPISHNVTGQALLPGARLQSVKVQPQVLTLAIDTSGATPAAVHSLRKSLINLVKPNLVSPLQPSRLRYSGAGPTVEIAGDYDSGLTGAVMEANSELVPLRFICYDPFWRRINDSAASLTSKLSVSDADYIIKRIAGVWSNVSTQFNGTVYAIVRGLDGSIYVGGSFTNVGDANGDYIVKVAADGTISSLGTGMNGAVYTLAIGPDGSLYAGGAFALAGGVANTSRIAKWDGVAWSALSTGCNDTVRTLAFGLDGSLYAGGLFALAGGIASTVRIAKWSGSAWTALGTGMTGGNVLTLAVDLTGNLYAGGTFTGAGGTATNFIAKWNGSAWAVLASATALTGVQVSALAVGLDGSLYVGGEFTNAGGVAAADNIARWTGSAWYSLGASGASLPVYALAVDSLGFLHAGGSFVTIGGLSSDYYAIWNGSAWTQPDVNLPAGSVMWSLLPLPNGDHYLGYDNSGTATASAITTVTNNGSSDAYPMLIVKRIGGTSATLEWLKNETTGKMIWFNYALLDGETLTVDLSPGAKTITSSMFGSVMRAKLSGSDFATWCLQSGSNDISLFVADAGSPDILAYLQWRDTHLSVDGVAT